MGRLSHQYDGRDVGDEDIESLVSKGLTTHRPKADIGGVNLSKAFLFTIRI